MKKLTVSISAKITESGGKWGADYKGKAGPNVSSGSWFGGSTPWHFATREAAVAYIREKAAIEADWFEFYGRPIVIRLDIDGQKEVLTLAKKSKEGKKTVKDGKAVELDKNMIKTFTMLKGMEVLCGELSISLRRDGQLYWQCANVAKQLDSIESMFASAKQILLLTMYDVGEGDDIDDLVKEVECEMEAQAAEEQADKNGTAAPVVDRTIESGVYSDFGI